MSDTAQDKKISEQDILKVFEEADEPFLTAPEIADRLPVSRQAVNYRLEKMLEKDLVGKKKTGARSVGWWAKVAPRLADEVRLGGVNVSDLAREGLRRTFVEALDEGDKTEVYRRHEAGEVSTEVAEVLVGDLEGFTPRDDAGD